MCEDPFHFKHLAFLSLYSLSKKKEKKKRGAAGSREMQVHQTVEVSWEPRPFQPDLRDSPGSVGPGSVPGWELRSHMPTDTQKHTQNKTLKPGCREWKAAERHRVRSREASPAASARNSEAPSMLGPSGGRTDAPCCGRSISLLCLVFLLVSPGLPSPS